ncbi:MAG TPA: thioredoxin domain-containing protein [Burkholderiales bacterium]|nr:thioredoxin domain-containing protein [Burkholderiales bacterium]
MSNRLANETSPYLRQHADNPVNWYPWGEDALKLSREQDKPILLSIGYSACHWCHVMAHESFEDPEMAKLMNEHFINIKVDREERPDLDQIYQAAHYMLTQRGGGWPLTLFLTPEQKPFFGGTYFPKQSRYNLPGFGDLLKRIAGFYHEHRDEIEKQNESLLAALERMQPEKAQLPQDLDTEPAQRLMAQLQNSFDRTHGGFGDAPKFPHPAEIEFCLRRFATSGDGAALHLACFTLEKMAKGGIYDQLGSGFCRYSVDQYWTIPHFEKMLYDNGPLLRLYCDAWLASGNPLFKTVAEETARWVLREMQSPEGGYYSTLDADSEHEEGKFYVWTREEIASLLNAEEYAVAAPHYGLDRAPNFEGGFWHLNVYKSLDEVAKTLSISIDEAQHRLDSAKQKLFAAREQRVHPGRDEKILTSWNGLMIKGMAHAARVFGHEHWLASAQRACDFIRNTLWRDRRLLATYKGAPGADATTQHSGISAKGSTGRAHLNAYLDDYAFMLDALLELLQTQFRKADFDFAKDLASVMLEQFEDRELGGFFFTSHDHEKLIHRPKAGHDNATPSGNGIAIFALQRLGHLLGEPRYLETAEHALKLFYAEVSSRPNGYTTIAIALEEFLVPPQTVILRGEAEAVGEWQQELAREYLPHALVLALPKGLAGLPQTLDREAKGNVNAWVCQGVKCLPTINKLQELKQVCKTGQAG